MPLGRLAEASVVPACLPPLELEAMWEQGFSNPQLFSLHPTLPAVSNHDIKYQLTTWSNWGTSMCLAFAGHYLPVEES